MHGNWKQITSKNIKDNYIFRLPLVVGLGCWFGLYFDQTKHTKTLIYLKNHQKNVQTLSLKL